MYILYMFSFGWVLIIYAPPPPPLFPNKTVITCFSRTYTIKLHQKLCLESTTGLIFSLPSFRKQGVNLVWNANKRRPPHVSPATNRNAFVTGNWAKTMYFVWTFIWFLLLGCCCFFFFGGRGGCCCFSKHCKATLLCYKAWQFQDALRNK